jgi:hypothetical protein
VRLRCCGVLLCAKGGLSFFIQKTDEKNFYVWRKKVEKEGNK